MKSKEILAKAGIFNIGGSITGRALGFVFTFIMARLLGSALLGNFWMGVSVFGMALGFAHLPASMILLRFVAAYEAAGDWAKVRGTLLFTVIGCLIVSGVLTAGLYWAAPEISIRFFHSTELIRVLRFMAWALPFAVMTQVAVNAALGFKEFKPIFLILNLFDPAIRILLVLLFFVVGLRLLCAPFAYAWVWVADVALGVWLLRRIIPAEVWSVRASYDAGEWLRYAGFMQWGSLLGSFLSWSDGLILGHYLTPDAVGRYGVAFRLVGLAAVTQVAITPMLGPLISAALSRKDHGDVSELLKAQCRWQTAAALPFLLALVAYGRPILRLFGPGFEQSYSCLLLLTLAILLNSVLGSIGDMLNMSEYYTLSIVNMTIHCAALIGFSVALVPRYGLIGAGLAYVLGVCVVRGLTLFQVFWIYRMHPFHRWTVQLLLIAFASATLLLVVPAESIWSIIPLVSYTVGAWRLGILPEDREIVDALLRDWLPAGSLHFLKTKLSNSVR